MLLLAGGMTLGTGCNANKGGNENAGIDAASVAVLAEPAATDQAETTTTTTDPVKVMPADSARNRQK